MCSWRTPRSKCYWLATFCLWVCLPFLEAVQQNAWIIANGSLPDSLLLPGSHNQSDGGALVKSEHSFPLLATPRERLPRKLLQGSLRTNLSEPVEPIEDAEHVNMISLQGSLHGAEDSFENPPERFVPGRRKSEVVSGMTWSVLRTVLPGILLLCMVIPLFWLNERRSIRVEALVTRGLAECEVIDTVAKAKEVQDGQLVCVRGQTCATWAATDAQFSDAVARNCLQLQSTIEVFEHVPIPDWIAAGTSRPPPRFEKEWAPFHSDLKEFRKPGGQASNPPINPDPPQGLALGTYTHTASQVTLESYVLPPNLLGQFVKFVPAMDRLPQVVHFHGVAFHAHTSDGYYYARPGVIMEGSRSPRRTAPTQASFDISANPQVGDLRVRFLCVPEGDATVVAVQCRKNGEKTFVPYRPIARGIFMDQTEKKRQVQEGSVPLKEFSGQDAALCCSPCTTFASCCNQDVVTEEVMYVSDRHDSLEKVFRQVVPRNRCRVGMYRLAICFLIFCGLKLVLSPVLDALAEVLQINGPHADTIIVLGATLVLSALIAATSYASYSPFAACKYFCIAGLISASPFLLEHFGASPSGM